jgi:hypothetical protein
MAVAGAVGSGARWCSAVALQWLCQGQHQHQHQRHSSALDGRSQARWLLRDGGLLGDH